VSRIKRSHCIPLGVAAVVVASLGFDLGHHATTTDQASDLRGLVNQVKTDLASCNASVRDSFAAYAEVVSGRPEERNAAVGIIRGNQPNCTPVANSDLYDLATLEAPGTLRSFQVQQATVDLATWAFPDASAAISDVGRLLAEPADQAARSDLTRRTADMARLDQSAEGRLAAAAAALHTRVANLDLRSTDLLAGVSGR
jgi:hypothetical protein